jgi:uncharacterized protein (TIGR03435 family)
VPSCARHRMAGSERCVQRVMLGQDGGRQDGVSGTFDVHLEFARDEAIAGIGTPGGPPAVPGLPADPDKASIFTAFRQQLGLGLESDKGPVEVLVIDHVEKPSGN